MNNGKAMESIIQWLDTNKEWLFSGIGLSILTVLFSFRKRKQLNNQYQKNGKNSLNIQAGRDIRIENDNSKTK